MLQCRRRKRNGGGGRSSRRSVTSTHSPYSVRGADSTRFRVSISGRRNEQSAHNRPLLLIRSLMTGVLLFSVFFFFPRTGRGVKGTGGFYLRAAPDEPRHDQRARKMEHTDDLCCHRPESRWLIPAEFRHATAEAALALLPSPTRLTRSPAGTKVYAAAMYTQSPQRVVLAPGRTNTLRRGFARTRGKKNCGQNVT